MGLNAILATAGQSLELFSAGIEVAGQNVANANTPGYVRETLNVAPSLPYENNGLLIGTGARGTGVRQQIDLFLESQIHRASADLSASRARQAIYSDLETQLNELSDLDLSTALNDFLAALQDVANQPESVPLRQLAIQEGASLARDIRTLSDRVNDLRSSQSRKVELLVQEANDLIDQIRDLNSQIVRLESSGLNRSDAGALRTQRYQALNRLSEILAIRATEREGGNVDVFVGNTYLILGGSVQRLEVVWETDRDMGVANVRLDQTKVNPATGGGELYGVIEGRDTVLGGFLDQLNAYAANLIFEFNRIHASGQGVRPFSSLTSEARVADTTARLNQAGLTFTPSHGSFELKIINESSGVTETAVINVDLDGLGGDDTTLEDLRDQINAASGGRITATITSDRRLKLDAATGYQFAFANDTSGVLAALGLNVFFSGSDARNVSVSDSVAADHELFATGQGGGPADNRNVLQLAQFTDNPINSLSGMTLDQYYEAMVANVAQASASESALADGFDGFRESLLSQREQFSGVSLDEEAILILKLQQAYQAAARVVRTVDELFDVLVTM
ncbi:MAG: flagellar hook-associated protein FlgK [Planctomycetes bacterium]|nr:flagellar hook-associated protein FlgK [Planctomycetota bacterium]